MELTTRPQFYFDIIEEIEYLARRAGPETARRWHRGVDQTIQQLLRHPYIGRQRTDLKPVGIRSWRVKNFRRWLIFYAVRDNTVTLLRVRYGMMDLSLLEFAG